MNDDKKVKSLVSLLQKKQISIWMIPSEYKDNMAIIDAERKLGLRILGKRGYDIIRDQFFAEETVDEKKERMWFNDFKSYYDFVDGEIYENACYYQLDPAKVPAKVDLNRLYKIDHFVENTVDEDMPTISDEDLLLYKEGEKRKKQLKEWLDIFEKCKTPEEFKKAANNFKKSCFYNSLTEYASKNDNYNLPDVKKKYSNCFIWSYIYHDLNDKSRFNNVMSYVSDYPSYGSVVRELCTVYKPSDVASAYNYQREASYQGNYKQNKRIKDFAKAIESNMVVPKGKKAFFDKLTNYFWEETKYEILPGSFTNNQGMSRWFSTYRLFESFGDFVDYRNGDLSGCDLSGYLDPYVDFLSYKTNDNTKLPAFPDSNVEYSVVKLYIDDSFKVLKTWTKSGKELQHKVYGFVYFFDFLAFLKKDLSEADLISCDGLINLKDVSGINFDGALLTSDFCEKFNIDYKSYSVDTPNGETEFSFAEDNERANEIATLKEDDVSERDDCSDELSVPENNMANERIYYVSDIHFCHLLLNNKVKSKQDIVRLFREVAMTISKESKGYKYVLIAGDISFNYIIFQEFIRSLDSVIGNMKRIIFVIGNHDIWSCPSLTFDDLVVKYREYLSGYNMYLLQNDVLYTTDGNELKHISEKELIESGIDELKEQTRDARLIFFGGTGFAGYNEVYNASFGLYRYNETILYNRDFEIKETKKIDGLYNKVTQAFQGKNVIVMTHMPLRDWHKHSSNDSNSVDIVDPASDPNNSLLGDYQPGFVYVSGHTHRNFFYDDGNIRIYSDNQFGYNKHHTGAMPHLKFFEISTSYDWFSDLPDGIHEITDDDYRKFYMGKNIKMTLTHDFEQLYVLKKDGYYCFVQQSKKGILNILNGGSPKRLESKDIKYYFDNMDQLISTIKNPLDQYTDYQRSLAAEVKKIGGSGRIHGIIIDIDFFNHIFVNPLDGKVCAYFALDMINKVLYPSIPALLEERCPRLHENYLMLTKGKTDNLPILSTKYKNKPAKRPQQYLDTDIYKASKEIRKMQKLYSNILSTWPSEFEPVKKLE